MMKIRGEFLAVAFLLLAAFAYAGKWTVDSFDSSPDPGEADKFIAAETGSGLKPVQPGQVTPQSGRLYVRQKFEDPFGDESATYQIFQGKATEASKSLGKIGLDGIPYATLLKMKLFYSKTATGDDDLETVYFDGKDIFVEGEDPVYINLNGKMEELKPVASNEYKISITSEPSGATVTVSGVQKGTTPVTFSVAASKTITALVSKEGYYTAVKPVTPNSKQTAQEGILLTEKKAFVNPAVAYRSQLQTAVAGKDTDAIKKLKTSVQQTLNSYNSDSKKNIDAIMSKFPANPAKVAEESSTDYSSRQSIWNNAQAAERKLLNDDAARYFQELKDLSAEIDAAVGDMDFSLKYEYIPTAAIEITNLGIKDFSANTELSNSRVKFKYEKAKIAYGSVARNELAEEQENVHGVLKLWNTPNENGKYASIYDIAFFYNETPLKVIGKGNFTLSDATPASRNTERDLNNRIAKYSSKAAWDKRDEAATLAALRAGETSDGGLARAAPKEEAYYDEDEDEEEFEEEMDDQQSKDYSRYGAASSATDIFGHSDEILFWTGMVFAAAAIGTGVVGFLEHLKYSEADKAITSAKDKIDTKKNEIRGQLCPSNPSECPEADVMIHNISNVEGYTYEGNRVDVIFQLNKYIDTNKTTKESYNKTRLMWWGGAGVALATSIVLFAW